MSFLMINSPLYRDPAEEYDEVLPPIWLGYICTDLKNNGIDVELLDAVAWKISLNKIIEHIVNWGFTYVGLNVFSTNSELVKELIKSVPSKVEFIIWWAFTKTNYAEILNWESNWNITVVVGEADTIVSDIVKWEVRESPLLEMLDNKAYFIDKKSDYFPGDISNQEIDRTFFEYEPTINVFNGKKEGNIIVSRGCVYDCAFCSAAISLNKWTKIRTRNPESVRNEIQSIQNIHPEIESIRVLDDLFLKNAKSVQLAIDIFEGFNITWRAMAHIQSFRRIDDNLLKKLRESWCTELSIWIESGNQKMLTSINKVNSPDEIKDTIERIFKAWIGVKWYFIFWFPWETEEQFQDSYNLAKILKDVSIENWVHFRVSVFQFRPYHWTQLYYELEEAGYNIEEIKSNSDFWDKTIWEYDFWNWNFSWSDYDTLKSYIIKTRELNEQ